MSSERAIRLAVLVALASPACSSPAAPQPPTFPAGGLLAAAAPLPVYLPDGTTPVLLALEGVYDTSTRFGSELVLHSSTWGALAASVPASLALLANAAAAFARMRGGCLDSAGTGPGRDTLVFEGHWRSLDDPDPSPSTTGLIRLFVQPAAVARQLCLGQ